MPHAWHGWPGLAGGRGLGAGAIDAAVQCAMSAVRNERRKDGASLNNVGASHVLGRARRQAQVAQARGRDGQLTLTPAAPASPLLPPSDRGTTDDIPQHHVPKPSIAPHLKRPIPHAHPHSLTHSLALTLTQATPLGILRAASLSWAAMGRGPWAVEASRAAFLGSLEHWSLADPGTRHHRSQQQCQQCQQWATGRAVQRRPFNILQSLHPPRTPKRADTLGKPPSQRRPGAGERVRWVSACSALRS